MNILMHQMLNGFYKFEHLTKHVYFNPWRFLSNLGFFASIFSKKQSQWSIKIHEINYAHSTNM